VGFRGTLGTLSRLEAARVRIAHVSVGSFPELMASEGGAIQRRVIELAAAQAAAGHEVVAYSVATSTRTEQHRGVTVRFLRCWLPSPAKALELQSRVISQIARNIVTGNVGSCPDVVHSHSEPELALAKRLLRAPVVLSYDNYWFRRSYEGARARIYRRVLLANDLLLPCSGYCMSGSEELWHLKGTGLAVLYNGVNTAQFRPARDLGEARRRKLGLGAGPVVLYVGRVCMQKGVGTLLAAFERIRAAVPGARLVVAGPIASFSGAPLGRAEQGWPERMSRHGALYLGAVPEPDLCATYNMADVFVMPTQELEMFGMAALEAQACGVPVVSSDHGGLRETVPDAVGGRFAVGDPDALARKVLDLLEQPELVGRCRQAALDNAARYRWDVLAQRSLELYELARRRKFAAGPQRGEAK